MTALAARLRAMNEGDLAFLDAERELMFSSVFPRIVVMKYEDKARYRAELVSKISISPRTNCWEWTGRLDKDGYAQCVLRAQGSRKKAMTTRAARAAYILFRGPIDDALVIDHVCRNRRCINPSHLEAVTTRENLLRGKTSTASKAAQTHCVNGHEFTPENTYHYPNSRNNGLRRTCRQCAIDRVAVYRSRAKAAS